MKINKSTNNYFNTNTHTTFNYINVPVNYNIPIHQVKILLIIY